MTGRIDSHRLYVAFRRYRLFVLIAAGVVIAFLLTEQSEVSGFKASSYWPTQRPSHGTDKHTGHRPDYYDVADDYDEDEDGPRPFTSHTVVNAEVKGRVLITGGGGMLGKVLVRRLLSSGIPVTVLDKIFFEDESESIKAGYRHADLTFVQGDIRDPNALRQALAHSPIGVIHLAAVSRVEWCLENEKDCMDVNVEGTRRVMEAFKGAWFIQASSREVYGNAKTFPVTEDTPHNPANAYGSSKAKAEAAIDMHMAQTGAALNVVMLRFSNIYGSVQDHKERLIPAIFTNALGSRTIQIMGGAQDLGFVHVQDAANAVLKSVNFLERYRSEDKSHTLEAFNVGSAGSTPAMTLIRKIMAITNSSSPVQMIPGDNRFPDKFVSSGAKAKEWLGFEADINIDEGLHMLAHDYLQESISFLDNKHEEMCGTPEHYSKQELLRLDGCSGAFAINVDGQPKYAAWAAPSEKEPVALTWQDVDEPQVWDFGVKTEGSHAVLTVTREVDGKVIQLELEEDGVVLGREKVFRATVEPHTGFVSLTTPSGKAVNPFGEKSPGPYRYRLTPFCCPHKPSPWPFFQHDPLASAILDQRTETRRQFNASQIWSMCDRLSQASKYASSRLHSLLSLPQPVVLDEAPLPTGTPYDWRLRNLDVCSNMCDHPATCIDTGDCACSLAACSPRHRFPFFAYANLPDLSYPPPTTDWSEIETHNPDMLIDQVAGSSWLNVLRPSARRYLSRTPSLPHVHLTQLPEDQAKARLDNAEYYDRLQTEWHGCFSADSVMERGVKAVGGEYQDQQLVFMPYYAYTLRFPNVEEWAQNALDHHLPSSFEMTNMIVPFTFDWGRCNTVLHNLFQVRDWSTPPPLLNYASAWQPMGDLNSPCYFMDQDVVIPPRTCLQDKLRARFGHLSRVRPSLKRSVLSTFKGSPNGAGSSVRTKVMCPRSWKAEDKALGIPRRLEGGEKLDVFWNEYKPDSDYLETIGDTVFCALPRGTTGWSTRLVDVIYAGCIPILIGDQTQHPFWDMLDWASFSVQIQDYELDHLEAILLKYSWEEVARMQTNLMLVRDAFLYPAEDHMHSVAEPRGPFWYAMHATAMLRKTRWPGRI